MDGMDQTDKAGAPAHAPNVSWQELIYAAMNAVYPTHEQLEKIIDRLERTR